MADVRVVRICPICEKESHVVVDEEKYQRFVDGRSRGESSTVNGVQVLFPELTADEREILVSGSHGECYDRLFGEPVKTGRDRTPWPSHDASGNRLRHTELCAWRFGGDCDCFTQEVPS